jgi:L,D-peptidoglycan transpeptidase YkuD (ErfK/YbiS/YcfS/YnhG family)
MRMQVPAMLVVVGVFSFAGGSAARADPAMVASSWPSAAAITSTQPSSRLLAPATRTTPGPTTKPDPWALPATLRPAARATRSRQPPPQPPTGDQLIVVSAPAYGDTYAKLTAYDVTVQRRRVVFGRWTARIGYNGFAAPGQKREGDGRTPSGTYGFQFMFGVYRDPGLHYAYRRAHPYDVWDDDPSSPKYNKWVDDRTQNPGMSPEPMDQMPAYDDGAVIAYNTARTPGLGSAIFIHVDMGGPTAGCVSLPMGELLDVLRWLDPARSPHIEMGVGADGH